MLCGSPTHDRAYPAHTGHSPDVVSMSGQRRRRWANIETALGECPVCAGYRALYKAKTQYLLTCEVSRYCLFALHGDIHNPVHDVIADTVTGQAGKVYLFNRSVSAHGRSMKRSITRPSSHPSRQTQTAMEAPGSVCRDVHSLTSRCTLPQWLTHIWWARARQAYKYV